MVFIFVKWPEDNNVYLKNFLYTLHKQPKFDYDAILIGLNAVSPSVATKIENGPKTKNLRILEIDQRQIKIIFYFESLTNLQKPSYWNGLGLRLENLYVFHNICTVHNAGSKELIFESNISMNNLISIVLRSTSSRTKIYYF